MLFLLPKKENHNFWLCVFLFFEINNNNMFRNNLVKDLFSNKLFSIFFHLFSYNFSNFVKWKILFCNQMYNYVERIYNFNRYNFISEKNFVSALDLMFICFNKINEKMLTIFSICTNQFMYLLKIRFLIINIIIIIELSCCLVVLCFNLVEYFSI